MLDKPSLGVLAVDTGRTCETCFRFRYRHAVGRKENIPTVGPLRLNVESVFHCVSQDPHTIFIYINLIIKEAKYPNRDLTNRIQIMIAPTGFQENQGPCGSV